MCAANRQERNGHVMWWATCPENQSELEMYADKGVLVATGSYENSTDGQRYPVYCEKRALFEAILEDLEAGGLIIKTGERPGREGRLLPVYGAVPHTPKGSDPTR
jgi:hypothetical protein